MKYFWHGFESKTASRIQFKKHVIVLFWEPENAKAQAAREELTSVAKHFPSVKVKIVNVKKDPTKPTRLGVSRVPTVLLLREGREVDRISGGKTLLEQLFRKAHA